MLELLEESKSHNECLSEKFSALNENCKKTKQKAAVYF